MRQLTSLDSQFLAMETPKQTGHVAGLAILDTATTPGGDLACADIQALIAERLPLLPPLRWRLEEVPLGLDYPYWVDDPDFDLHFHVRELGLARPGTDEQLAEQVARIVSRPLDRSRPLWELYLISGLESGHTAMLTKIHHALIDGMSGAEIMGLLLDLEPEGREVRTPDHWGDDDLAPGTTGMLARGLLGVPRYPLRALRALPAAIPNLDETPFGTLPGAGAISRLAGLAQRTIGSGEGGERVRETLAAPKTSFNGRISAHRRFTFGSLSLDDVKTVKNQHGCTVNDVIVSICAGAVRRWLLAHDELPAEPLVTQIPISVRTGEQVGTYGNRIMLMGTYLHTDEADPVLRLERTHLDLDGMKERHRALPAGLLQDANDFIPPAVFSRAARLTFRLATSARGRPTWNLVISNVPGPQIPLYCAGARLVANYPVSVITDGMGLNITVMSYCGKLDFGIVADREQMPDVGEMLGWLEEELATLLATVPGRSPKAKPISQKAKRAPAKAKRASPKAKRASPKAKPAPAKAKRVSPKAKRASPKAKRAPART